MKDPVSLITLAMAANSSNIICLAENLAINESKDPIVRGLNVLVDPNNYWVVYDSEGLIRNI